MVACYRRLGVVVAVAVTLHGCSYVLIDRPPSAVRRGDLIPGCTTENTYPILDVGLAALSVVTAIYAVSGYARLGSSDMMTQRELTGSEKVYIGTSALIEGGLFALSARHGFTQTARCRELQSTLPAPQAYPPPYPPPAPTPYPPPPAATPYPPPAPPPNPYAPPPAPAGGVR